MAAREFLNFRNRDGTTKRKKGKAPARAVLNPRTDYEIIQIFGVAGTGGGVARPNSAGDALSTRSTMAVPRRFEYRQGSSNKFWEVSIRPELSSTWIVIANWGRIGTRGQQTEKVFGARHNAEAHFYKMINQKLNKGYIEVT